MQKLDRIFNGQDVKGLVLIHLVDDGRECGRFAGTSGAGDQHDAIPDINNFLERLGQAQFFKVRNLVGYNAHNDGATAALAKNIYAEASHSRYAVREVRGAVLFQLAQGGFVFAHDVIGDAHGVLRGERLETFVLQLHQLAVHFNLRGAAGTKNKIADVAMGFVHGANELGGLNDAWRLRWRWWCRRCRWRRWQGWRQCSHDDAPLSLAWSCEGQIAWRVVLNYSLRHLYLKVWSAELWDGVKGNC